MKYDDNRQGHPGPVMSRQEIIRMARERESTHVPGLTRTDLQALYAELNRTRYRLEDQHEFIRFFFLVREALLFPHQHTGGLTLGRGNGEEINPDLFDAYDADLGRNRPVTPMVVNIQGPVRPLLEIQGLCQGHLL